MRIGINAGFGDPLGHLLPFITATGFRIVRQELPTYPRNDERLRMLMHEFVGSPLVPLFLLGGGKMQRPDGTRRIEPDEIADVAAFVARTARALALDTYLVEVGNEPDLAHDGYASRPQDFAAAVRQTRDRLRAEQFTGLVVSGGVSNLNTRGIGYVERMLAPQGFTFPDDVVVGFHRYPEKGKAHGAPHAGFTSRENEMQRFTALIGARSHGCTEFGYHTATERVGLSSVRRTDADVAASIMFDFAFFADHGCDVALLFQLNDGPDDTMEHRYGIRALDGTPKPVVSSIRSRFAATT
ncbi:MAG TPA: hypothetical protein VM032_01370 [Vicinamibacterales bacterium]|nr:hypothetical protein [Vicinamibacterales bacterium]